MGISKIKKQKACYKTIKCIYSELGLLILLKVPFDLGLINLFQAVLDQRPTISSLPPTSEQALYRLLRLFFKSQRALTPLLLLSAKSHARLTTRPRIRRICWIWSPAAPILCFWSPAGASGRHSCESGNQSNRKPPHLRTYEGWHRLLRRAGADGKPIFRGSVRRFAEAGFPRRPGRTPQRRTSGPSGRIFVLQLPGSGKGSLWMAF